MPLRSKSRPEDELLFRCARQRFSPEDEEAVAQLCRGEPLRWDVVAAVAQEHGVAPLVYANLTRCDAAQGQIPKETFHQLKGCVVRNLAAKQGMARRITEVAAFFRARSIDLMLLKGAALDRVVYDRSWYTTSADVDVVIRPRPDEVAEKARKEINAFLQGFPSFEFHYFEHHDVQMNGALEVDFERIWRDAVPTPFGEQTVFVMAPEDLLIAACINSCRKRFFRLKALCDIAETTRKCTDLRWEEVVRKARAYQCAGIVYAALFIADLTVGCRLPAGVLDDLAVGPVRAAVIRFLGRRMAARSLSALYSGVQVFGKPLGLSLVLPYVTYRWHQVWQNVGTLQGQLRTYAQQKA
jgi:hypothetical protein